MQRMSSGQMSDIANLFVGRRLYAYPAGITSNPV